MHDKSQQLFARAKQSIPGGVNSPVRAFNGVGGSPVFIARADGAYMVTEDGQRLIDYVGSWGPMIVGHRHPKVVAALEAQLAKGVSFGAPTTLETQLAEQVCRLLPSVEKVRFVSSGTEAAMSAIRLARGITGRPLLLKFEGCYHGHADSLLVKAGSGVLTLGLPDSPGVPEDLAKLTLNAPFNDLDTVANIFANHGRDIAAVIVEPIAGNMNCVPPRANFLPGLRDLTAHHGALLIFDEVMTGFRVHKHSAQGLYNVSPDLTVFGKVIGGGLPVGAFGGPAKWMDYIAPIGPVYQAGTLSGNPLAMASGLATLALLEEADFYQRLSDATVLLLEGLQKIARDRGVPMQTNYVCGMFGIFFTSLPAVTCFSDVKQSDVERFKRFFHGMLAKGVYLAPSAFEAGFISSAHSANDIEATLAAARDVFATL